MEIDINKKLQDMSNQLVNTALERTPLNNSRLEDLLKGIVMMAMKQGFIFGVRSVQQTTELLLKLSKQTESKDND